MRHTILVVDDEADVVKSVKDLLRLDYRVLGCTSAQEAMELMKTEEVQVVMTDQRMPGMTGVELLKDIRGKHPHAIRLLFTGYADIRAVIEAINQGNVYRYITKPWDPDELQSIIREAIERYELMVQREQLLEELKNKNEQLESANKQLTESSQLKHAFLQVASHELRTPLTILLGISKLALKEHHSDDQVHRFLQRMDLAAERLRRLVDQIITMLSTERFDDVLHPTPTDLHTLLQQAADDVAPFTQLRRQTLATDFDGDLGSMPIDVDKIRDSINHLLLNAIKFTADGGEIRLIGRRDASGAFIISVSDTGCGIDEACKQRLFDPFFTGFDVSRHTSGTFEHLRRGLGLGLSVVKAFVELHGGTVTVDSEVGRGSTFTLSLPDRSRAERA